jgi:hypothetical protein
MTDCNEKSLNIIVDNILSNKNNHHCMIKKLEKYYGKSRKYLTKHIVRHKSKKFHYYQNKSIKINKPKKRTRKNGL